VGDLSPLEPHAVGMMRRGKDEDAMDRGDTMTEPSGGAMHERTCATCRYWRTAGRGDMVRPELGAGWGQCRRMPPALPVVRDDKLLLVGLWPHTEEGDWCGEWQGGDAA